MLNLYFIIHFNQIICSSVIYLFHFSLVFPLAGGGHWTGSGCGGRKRILATAAARAPSALAAGGRPATHPRNAVGNVVRNRIGMLAGFKTLVSCPMSGIRSLIIVLLVIICMQWPAKAIVAVPNSNCFTFNNDSRLVDFTDLIGQYFEYNEKDSVPSDLVVQFCKDVQRRSQAGYVDFGRFINSHSFLTGSQPIDFIQTFRNGDLAHCETTFEKMGRTAQVNIICGQCPNNACQGKEGCICNVSYDELMCRATVELAMPCPKSGPRVFKGFSVGFHPRSSELVYNGLTRLGFEQFHHEFSFQSDQSHVSLYLSAVYSLSGLVGKPSFKVNPVKGLDVTLTGSGTNGAMPTTLSPTILNVIWRCEITRSSPYEVNISIPIEGYDPVEFTLTKRCGHTQEKERNPLRGWATFGIISCIFIILFTLLCCGGFIYKTRVEHQSGLYALPGMTILSAFLDAVGGPSYTRADDHGRDHANQASWERIPGSTSQATHATKDSRYGSI
uniref:AT4G36440-like protein n=1 Tax=Leersia perrieri TaxID=77586 RepID=A0A0D9UZB8_9ORYZ